jgi:hypothetical protein
MHIKLQSGTNNGSLSFVFNGTQATQMFSLHTPSQYSEL